MIYLLLLFEFFKIGLFTIGGGLAALPFLYRLTDVYDWFTPAQLTYMIAISESTPGPIAINMATFAGFHTAGVSGGAVATLASIIPGMGIVLIAARFMDRFRENVWLEAGLYGIRPAVIALITVALITVTRLTLLRWDAFTASMDWATLVDHRAVAIFAVALAAIVKFDKHPILYILAGGVAGILFAP